MAQVGRAARILEELREKGLGPEHLDSLEKRLLQALSAANESPSSTPTTSREPEADGRPGEHAAPVAATAACLDTNADGHPDAVAQVSLTVDAVTGIHYAMHANEVRTIREIRIENDGERTCRDLRVRLTAEPPFAGAHEIRVDEIRPGQLRRLDEPELPLDHAFLDRLTERVPGALRIELRSGQERLSTTEHRLTVFARNCWAQQNSFRFALS